MTEDTFGEQIMFTDDDIQKPDLLATRETGLRCGELIDEMFKLNSEVNTLEKTVEDKKARIKEISEEMLPGLMASMNVAEWKSLSTGAKVKLEGVCRASLKKKSPDDVALHENLVSYLAEQGYDAIAKREVAVYYSADKAAEAKLLHAELESRQVPVSMAIDIHHSTLSATLREISKQGGVLPDPEKTGINLYQATVAKITLK